MKIKTIILTLGLSLGVTSVAFTQITDTVDVTATVNAGTSTLNITETSVAFGAVLPVPGNSRFESGNVTGDYFAANGPWELTVYTTNAGDAEGLVGTDVGNLGATIPLKVDPDADNDVTNDDDWTNTPEFFYVLDDGNANAAKVASSANENPAENNSLVFNFGIDAAGSAVGAYSTTVTAELAILP